MPHVASITPDSDHASAIERVRTLSRPFSISFSVLSGFMFIAIAAAIAFALFYEGPHVRISADYTHLIATPDLTEEVRASSLPIGELPFKDRLVGIFTLGILQWGALGMIFLNARRLFRLYEQSIIFGTENVECLRRLAGWLIAWGFAPAIGHQIAISLDVHDEGWFRMSSVAGVLLGCMLFVIARVFNLGREIEQERASIV